ncbi:hypothetical protein NIES4071_00670 [Calothrix sp. NIES-4071]|nr:hypothetical protein NIES4071_00670 [Calothrix sp. NIES-4071]BAZ54413.1 hypothetical protein NIES4105_00660 [Calothrix sp. NIES-4105]
MEHLDFTASCATFQLSSGSEHSDSLASTSNSNVNQINTDNPEEALSEAEIIELDSLEATVQRGLRAFWEIGQALRVLRDKRLYRQSYETFEEYCINRWEMSRRSAYYLIDAAAVYENVNHGSQILPANERQARPLTALTPSEQQEVWLKAVSTAPNGKITATHITKVVKEYQKQNDNEKFNRSRGNKTLKQRTKHHSKIQTADVSTSHIEYIDSESSCTPIRSCWNCLNCSPELLEEKEKFYCYQLGKLNFLEKDGETRAHECEYWTHRQNTPEIRLSRIPSLETVALTLQIPAYLQREMQDIAKSSGLELTEWATKILTEAVATSNGRDSMTINGETFEILREPATL